MYIKNVNDDARQCGVAVYILNTIPQYEIKLRTSLQAVACHVNVTGHRFAICSLYQLPSQNITESELNEIIDQLGTDFIVRADMNAKHPLWGSPLTDRRGRLISEVISNYYLHVLNDGTGTRLDTFTGNVSHIDLSICTSNLANIFGWKVHADNRCSDHYPIDVYLSFRPFLRRISHNNRPRWSVQRANWVGFTRDCTWDNDVTNNDDEPPDMCTKITQNVLNSANMNAPRANGGGKHRNM